MTIIYTLMGVPYVAAIDSVRGIVLRKAARRRSTLNTGDTKTVNGITYTLNENRRWTRADKKSRSKPRSPKVAQGMPELKLKNNTTQVKPKQTKDSLDSLEQWLDAELKKFEPKQEKNSLNSFERWIDAELKKLELKTKKTEPPKPMRGIKVDPSVTQDVDKIRQFKKVGAGAQGEVFIDDANSIAYKVPKSNSGMSQENTEVKLLLNANKVGVGPKMLGFNPNTGVIAMQKVDGVPLESKKNIGKVQAKNAIRDIVQQVQSLHDAKIAHTDIHGGNILIGKDGITIIDFGFAEQRPNQKTKATDIIQMMYVFQQQGWLPVSDPRATQKTAADDLIWELLREQKKSKLPPDIYNRIINLASQP